MKWLAQAAFESLCQAPTGGGGTIMPSASAMMPAPCQLVICSTVRADGAPIRFAFISITW